MTAARVRTRGGRASAAGAASAGTGGSWGPVAVQAEAAYAADGPNSAAAVGQEGLPAATSTAASAIGPGAGVPRRAGVPAPVPSPQPAARTPSRDPSAAAVAATD